MVRFKNKVILLIILSVAFVLVFYAESRETERTIDKINGSSFQIKNTVLALYGKGKQAILRLDMSYCGDGPVYLAFANQAWYTGNILYNGFNNLEKQIALILGPAGFDPLISMVSHGLVPLDKRDGQCFTNNNEIYVAFMFFEEELKYEDFFNIKELILILYVYEDLIDFKYTEEYIELLKSDKGKKIEIQIKDFEIIYQ